MFVDAYLQVATHLVEIYDLQMPLNLFLKEYFKNNKKYGSRDRKYIAELIYGYYRLGKQAEHYSVKERLLLGAFLSDRLPILFFEKTRSSFATQYHLTFHQKLAWIKEIDHIEQSPLFEISEGMSWERYLTYLYKPANIFIRIRRNKQAVLKALNTGGVNYKIVDEHCISLASKVALESILAPEDYVVQDYSSQQIGHFFKPVSKETWWDCCCASGGKSIMLLDKNHLIDLTMSDIRPSILQQMHSRMQRYGYGSNYRSFIGDVSKPVDFFMPQAMNAIICDVPCSGSGTWARSPEQFYFFDEEQLNDFHVLQVAILQNVIYRLKQGGTIYYITCSIFRRENEDVIEAILKDHALEICSMQLILGDEQGGDNMFICVMKNA